VSRYLLHTNLISNITKTVPSESLLAWMAEQIDENLFIASLTIAEIWRGVLEKPAGRKRDQLETWFAGPEGPSNLFAGRVLPFDEKAGLAWARLMAEGQTQTERVGPGDPLQSETAGVVLGSKMAYGGGICFQGSPMSEKRHVRLFRNGRNQAVRIPVEFELPGDEAIMHRDGERLVIEPVRRRGLIALLKSMKPLDEDFPEIEDPVPVPERVL
jgi:hypothetical protein